MNEKVTYSEGLTQKAAALGVKVPVVLLPKNLDIGTWAVIACDQYTQDQKYWDEVEYLTHEKPSTLHITLPEIYLNKTDTPKKIEAIKSEMQKYLDSSLFESYTGFVFTKRKTASGTRHGILFCLDLERYDYDDEATALTKASERVITERIGPRLAIRTGSALETPHIMLLFDDKLDALFNTAEAFIEKKAPLYSGSLMLGGGELTGYLLNREEEISSIVTCLQALHTQNPTAPLFLVGDGNHSLATAKKVWENYKEAHSDVSDHPLRYALVEAVNLYDAALKFSAIHRVLFQCDAEKLKSFLEWDFGNTATPISTFDILCACVKNNPSCLGLGFCAEGEIHYFLLDTVATKGTNPYCAEKSPTKKLIIKKVDSALEKFLLTQKSTKVDYIHSEKELRDLVIASRNAHASCTTVCVILPPIEKASLFNTVAEVGTLPRKSFSMGVAEEKRYYMEVRRLDE